MKENKIEKLILDLSNRWDCSPQEAVDRLNSMNESEINKLINSMTKKFENGGFIDCLRNGDSVEKCKCGCDKIAKAEGGNVLYPYHKGKFVQSVDSNPLYPAGDGEGQISGEIRPLGDTVTVYRTPSHIYTQTRTTNGNVFIDHSAPHGSRRYYTPESKSRGFMRNVAPSWMVDLMNGVKEKFSTDVQTKKCGGSLPKKKKNYLKKK